MEKIDKMTLANLYLKSVIDIEIIFCNFNSKLSVEKRDIEIVKMINKKFVKTTIKIRYFKNEKKMFFGAYYCFKGSKQKIKEQCLKQTMIWLMYNS